jgi:NAD(P)-dependent dehydrogenase (short-subunit alcohol dehydrogenase family)
MTKWSVADIPDLSGRRAVVTGANSGIGYHTALELARHGADVVLACRDQGRGKEALDRLREHAVGTPGAASARLESLDLASLVSVRAFAERYGDAPLDILVNNAGVMALPRRTTADGFELQFGTNHLGHFALTGLLLANLLAAGAGGGGAARVVTVSSMAHVIGRMNFDDLQGERHYGRWRAYGQSKLANLLFAFELDRRARRVGAPLVSVASHPGYAATNLQTASAKLEGSSLRERFMELGNRVFAQPSAAGAQPSLYAATAPEVEGGTFWGPSGPMQRGAPGRNLVTMPAARREADAARLWDVSETLTGVRFGALEAAGA